MTVKRKAIRDGVIRATMIEVDLTCGDADANLAGVMSLFDSFRPESMIEAYIERAKKVLDNVNEGSRHKYARDVIGQAGEATKYLHHGDAQAAVQHAIWMMVSVWRMDVKSVEPEIVTGAKLRGASSRGNESKKVVATKDRATWQKIANSKWENNPRLTKSDVARMIDPDRWTYIRKQLDKPGDKTDRGS